jgi:hypothetical protein
MSLLNSALVIEEGRPDYVVSMAQSIRSDKLNMLTEIDDYCAGTRTPG